MKDPTRCVASRFGPYSPFFHFPRQNAEELGALHDWGWGVTDALVGYEAYAWGARSVLGAPCTFTHTAVITTGLEAGSLAAFATYLHSLADSYSHLACIQAMDSTTTAVYKQVRSVIMKVACCTEGDHETRRTGRME
jgi:hypothetical protein